MTEEYKPDKWLILKIDGKSQSLYKVFGAWSGGYTGSDNWRMNSGIVKVEKSGNYWLFYGTSGSVYKCNKNAYGSTVYGFSVLKPFIDASLINIEVLSGDEYWLDMDWIIS
jgi:hypothetical protein